MKKISIVLCVIFLSAAIVTTAISADVWGTSVESALQGPAYTGSIDPARSNPAGALGSPDNDGIDPTTFFSLGNSGSIVIKLAAPVSESLEIYEATWGNCSPFSVQESADVFVSEDGVNWTFAGTANNDASINPCYNQSGFISTIQLGGQCIQYVRVVDGGQAGLGDGFDLDAVGGNGPCQNVLEVQIDIKPNSFPSCFNSNERGALPVAVLGTADFDVRSINVATLELDGAPVITRGKSDKYMAAYEDYNNDGYLDLVVKFVDLGIYTPGDHWATLEGYLLDGTPIIGVGDICITQFSYR